MRLDKYLKVSGLIPRRTVAKEACDAGRILLNGRPAKAASEIAVGDRLAIDLGRGVTRVEVLDLPLGAVARSRRHETYRVVADDARSDERRE